ncbi:hypothetical protein IQ37_03305 [Chryseobacterium piperi]|uniref:Uncharacterized protein n=1 Tax=Chryseobacterium piperi TaxID=558152 RepID=A0A086BMN4_9FLAO|nr:hypothetical protein [Chryseobacterium piperi]ASW74172.1 hypothetical protein CJF12_07635 [Chryseobacterium piperi]KFF30198.1 hypothetical protein IQ37_03305 [Chryseobacterium piperi]
MKSIFEFLIFYQNEDIKEAEKKLKNTTNNLIFLHQKFADLKIPLADNYIFSEQLIIKFHLHNCSILSLSDGIYLHNSKLGITNKSKFLDISSIMTIIRAQYETLLMFQHLFINTDNEDEKMLRFYAWMMSSMIDREKTMTSENELIIEKVMENRLAIENTKNAIQKLESFKNLSEKHQKTLIEKGSGKLFKHWETIKTESFGNHGILSNIYYLLSVYSHSEGISSLQLKETKHLYEDSNNQKNLFLYIIQSLAMTAVMIKNICKIFKEVQIEYEKLPQEFKSEIDTLYNMAIRKPII